IDLAVTDQQQTEANIANVAAVVDGAAAGEVDAVDDLRQIAQEVAAKIGFLTTEDGADERIEDRRKVVVRQFADQGDADARFADARFIVDRAVAIQTDAKKLARNFGALVVVDFAIAKEQDANQRHIIIISADFPPVVDDT